MVKLGPQHLQLAGHSRIGTSQEEVHRGATVVAELDGEVVEEPRVDAKEAHSDQCAASGRYLQPDSTDARRSPT